MSPDTTPSETSRRARSRLGQALVETALMLPIILILLLGALDFGRLFFSWVTLHQAARIAANHASLDASTTTSDIPGVVADEYAVMSCDPGAPSLVYTRSGTAVDPAEVGDYATVTLRCDFSLLTPMSGLLFGDPITMQAESTFPVRIGCIDCGPGGPGDPPPLPPEQCRTVPEMQYMSVGGAREAWISAGFTGDFNTTAADTATVAPGPVIDPLDPACPAPLAIFYASVTVTTLPPDTEPEGCEVVPNLIGMTIADARDAWEATAFAGELLPPGPDADSDAAVKSQETKQDGTIVSSEPGVTCLDPTDEPPIDVEVVLGSAWPEPPPAPCQVPHLVGKTRNVGEAEWWAAQFTGTFSPGQGNWVIETQSLAGFSYQPCESSITVSQRGGR
jgi:hypothetical protein